MAFTKEDYMRLPKERLAELLVERDAMETTPFAPNTKPYVPYPSTPYIPWWKDMQIICGYGNN